MPICKLNSKHSKCMVRISNDSYLISDSGPFCLGVCGDGVLYLSEIEHALIKRGGVA